MPRLRISERIRLINLFNSDEFKNLKNKYKIVSEAAEREQIFISPRRLYDIIKKWKDRSN
jgi:hypothetical protein